MKSSTLNEHGAYLLERLQMLRDKAGLTQQQAGERLGWSRYRVWRIENGRLPEYAALRDMLTAYQVPDQEWDSYLRLWERSRTSGKPD
jgi:transcriptional regulator with XRE-family HTH domain